MKITFVNPAIAWDELDKSWIRHGIASLSAMVKTQGHKTDLIDLRRLSNQDGINWDLFEKEIKKSLSDIFAISILSANFDYTKECINRIRRLKPDVKIAIGGIHPSVMINECLNIGADVIFTGEGETVFLEWIEKIKKGEILKKEEIIKGKIEDLDGLPFVDRELFAPVKEIPIGYLKEPFHTIIIGRGCPYVCSFCYPAEKILFGRKVRMRSVDNVLTELKILERNYGLNSFLIHDDCFSAFPKYIQEFIEKKNKTLPRAEFYCQARADHIVKRPEMFRELAKAGLRGCLIGVESGSQRVLDFLKKGITVEQNIKAVEILQEIGITAWANLMTGIPTETKTEVIETIEMVRKLKKIQPQAICSWASYTPHPGSELFDYCEENNLSLIKKSADYRRYFEGQMNPKIKNVDYKFLEWAIRQC